MDSSAWLWIVPVVSSLLAGIAIVGLFAGPRRLEPVASGLAVLCGALAAYSLALIGQVYQRPDAVFYAFAFVVAALGGGYALASTLLLRAAQPLVAPALPDELPPPDPRTAVIVVCCIEPARYDVRATAGMLQSLLDEELLEISTAGLPFLFFAHKARYRSLADTSPSRHELETIADRLQLALADRPMVVDWASCSGNSRLALKVAAAVQRGHRRIVVACIAVARSGHMETARREVDDLRLDSRGVTLFETESVGSSDTVPQMLVDRVAESARDAERVGVVLVGHGQPEARARRNPGFEEAETVFLSRVRLLLAENGVANDSVRIAWSEWAEPGVTEEVRHLAALGCSHVIVVPAVFALDTLATRIDLEMAARRARLDDSVTVSVLPAWGPDEIVIEELSKRVLGARTS